MREIIKERLASTKSAEEKYNILREYIQALVLKVIESQGFSKNIAFVGGTALRFLYNLNRFSEDLDFSLIDKKNYDFKKILQNIESQFSSWNIPLEYSCKETTNIASSFLKFTNLLQEHGISVRKEQKLFIKIEIDTNPPAGFGLQLSFNQKYLPMNVLHFDQPSLFAGKLHAVLFRNYTKGRDIYDLMWFLGKKIRPNFTLLKNAASQSKVTIKNLAELKTMLIKKLQGLNFKEVQQEVGVFLSDKSELQYLTLDNLNKEVDEYEF